MRFAAPSRPRTEAIVTIVPPEAEARRDGRKIWRVWKWECRFVCKVREICEGVRERSGAPETVPALFMRIVQGPS